MITIAYGQYLPGHSWGRTERGGQRAHLVLIEPWNRIAVCGVDYLHLSEHISGTLCPKCARLAGVKSAADLAVDEEEARWWAAQRQPDG